ncbi:hypothetical protein ASD51_26055 [Streptomyces sp. Root55]|nr:hypothetical protein ASD51_26055 [Streptomyces sp. Root55]
MAAANRDLLHSQVSDGFGELGWGGVEMDASGSVGLLDVVDGETGDHRRPVGTEEQQQPRKAVLGECDATMQRTCPTRVFEKSRGGWFAC